MQRIEQTGLIYYQFHQWTGEAFRHAIFSRHGGHSPAPWDSLNVGSTVGDSVEAVAKNHGRMYEALGLDPAHVCSVWQVHSADTVLVTHPPAGRKWANRADGMVTNQPGLALVMRFADCTPILYYDPVQGAIGMAHAGWRGTLAGAQTSVVETMRDCFGTKPADLQVGIGPSIGPEHYQVGEEVVAQVREVFGQEEGVIRRAPDGSAYFDLWEANRRLLSEAGVQQIEIAGLCTYERTNEFFSHRAEKGQTGRFGAVMSL